MNDRERRVGDIPLSPERLRAGLTPEQLATLRTLEEFGWVLEFVRRPLFRDPLPVVYDRGRTRCALLEPDGSINEDHGLVLRD
ncbi:hypothetical protein [Marilutibacter chinensis]|uniref:DUF4224 domain-containing protein n=1 Tax=Marilutibacter chinensis TaxID=2912247 RepID=A0ABS9HUQ3_9GAMM|nr:hypothetical protein [Lysobacter chinensis]MCF7222639.1 hypothetical protein [Lysobacter chinensis]